MALIARLSNAAERLAAAGRRYGESPATVAARMTWFRLRWGVSLLEGLLTGLYDPRISPPRGRIQVGGRQFKRLLRQFNPSDDSVIDDKTIFAARCAGYGLPIPRLYAVTTPPLGVTADGRALHGADAWRRFFNEELPEEFVIKPAESWCGDLVEVYRREGAGFRSGEKTLSFDDLHRRLLVDAMYDRAIIQERLSNHPALAEFSPSPGLQTVRMVTVAKRTGEVEILYSHLKVITGTNVIDNFAAGSTGNLVVEADPDLGTLGVAFGPGPERIGTTSHLTHPVTGRPIAGFKLPDWERVRALARSAALRFLPMRAIGWDIALTPNGPVLIEGNTSWGPYCGKGFWFEPEQMSRLRGLL
jgi:hypothetical protein